ncbi:MAG: tyrosine-type recombinase/integrase [Bacilli bacterium]
MSFEEAYKEFKIYAAKRHKKESFESLVRDFNCKILPYFKNTNIYDLTEKDILRWKDELLSFDYSKKYLSKLYYVFTIFMDYCCLYYDLENNIVRNVGNFKVQFKAKKSDFYTKEEFEQFICGFDNIVYKSFFILMFYTGCRPSEAMALKFYDVKDNYLSINKSIERRGNRDICTTKNVYSVRNVVLCKKVMKCILELKKYYIVKYGKFSNDYFIFGGVKPLSGTSIDRYKLKACEKSNIRPITQHQFRHSYATYLISSGIPINTVSKLLGHSSVDTTARIYVHQDLTQEKRVLNTLDSHTFSFDSLVRNFKRKLSILKHFTMF